MIELGLVFGILQVCEQKPYDYEVVSLILHYVYIVYYNKDFGLTIEKHYHM